MHKPLTLGRLCEGAKSLGIGRMRSYAWIDGRFRVVVGVPGYVNYFFMQQWLKTNKTFGMDTRVYVLNWWEYFGKKYKHTDLTGSKGYWKGRE